jgi:hypothetical protein
MMELWEYNEVVGTKAVFSIGLERYKRIIDNVVVDALHSIAFSYSCRLFYFYFGTSHLRRNE